MTDVLILGAGPAGLTAAIYARRAGLTATVFDKGFAGGQTIITPEIENYPAIASISGPEFSQRLYEQAVSLGAAFKNEEVRRAQLSGTVKILSTEQGPYEGRTVILAGGVKRRELGCPGEAELAGKGVSYCATCDGMLYRGRAVAVWGLSPEAPQEANFLHGIGCSVTYIAGRRPDTLEAGVAFRAGRVEAVEGGAAVEAVRVGGAALPVQGVFILRAATPPDALVPGLALENGFVKTDAAMRTNIPGLFAAGDMTGKPLQVANAVGDGLVAALAAVDYLDGVSPMTD